MADENSKAKWLDVSDASEDGWAGDRQTPHLITLRGDRLHRDLLEIELRYIDSLDILRKYNRHDFWEWFDIFCRLYKSQQLVLTTEEQASSGESGGVKVIRLTPTFLSVLQDAKRDWPKLFMHMITATELNRKLSGEVNEHCNFHTSNKETRI